MKILKSSLNHNKVLMSKPNHAVVSIIMGSQSDLPVMSQAAEVLDTMDVPYELTIVSAHRTPLRMVKFAQEAATRGIKVIIAGAGGAAHLPGMVAALTHLPVIGVPVKSSNSIDGWDSLLSILQMPNGIPVATVALDAAKNAGLLAVEILATADENLTQKLISFRTSQTQSVLNQVELLQKQKNGHLHKK